MWAFLLKSLSQFTSASLGQGSAVWDYLSQVTEAQHLPADDHCVAEFQGVTLDDLTESIGQMPSKWIPIQCIPVERPLFCNPKTPRNVLRELEFSSRWIPIVRMPSIVYRTSRCAPTFENNAKFIMRWNGDCYSARLEFRISMHNRV